MVLLLAAVSGPWLLRRAAPAFAMAPRSAALALTGVACAWLAGLFALGPTLAWVSRGPSLLPGGAAIVCDRCLAAASPFDPSAASLAIPAIVPLAAPVVGVAAVVIGLWRECVRARVDAGALGVVLDRAAVQANVLGYEVRLLQSQERLAYSLPRNRGGIVVSSGAVHALTREELTAVLQHETAHVRQRHHLVLLVVRGVTHLFRWVPVLRALREAVPHYLEMAADRSAQRVAGTPAIAGALLKLGHSSELGDPTGSAVLHAAGSERVRLLIGLPRPRWSVALAWVAGGYTVLLAVMAAVVALPYLSAIASGC